jgi:hypothetical protein
MGELEPWKRKYGANEMIGFAYTSSETGSEEDRASLSSRD